MEKNNLKIKYIIGSYVDGINYPTKEDLFFIIDHWFHFEGGKDFIHNYRNLPIEDDCVFTDSLFKEKGLKNTPHILNNLLKNHIVVVKETKNTTYYKINNRKEI